MGKGRYLPNVSYSEYFSNSFSLCQIRCNQLINGRLAIRSRDTTVFWEPLFICGDRNKVSCDDYTIWWYNIFNWLGYVRICLYKDFINERRIEREIGRA